MGLFSFIKGAGQKLFGKKDKATPVVPQEVELSKADALKAEINRLGIPVNGLGIEFAEHVSVTGSTATNADREKIILAVGNVEGVASVGDNITVTNPEPESTFHEVKRGDTLSKIAKEVYGDAMKYPVIFEANKPMLEHPDKIYPGQILRIPAQ
ncbi:MAG: peptidoglycan-binding protein LysM [Bacteroidota bacterium]